MICQVISRPVLRCRGQELEGTRGRQVRALLGGRGEYRFRLKPGNG